jgi:hypothetical protein
MLHRRFVYPAAILVAAIGLSISPPSASAGSLVLANSGWTASWDSSLDPYLSLAVDLDAPDNSVLIEKSINFTSAAVNENGSINGAAVVFQQTAADAKRLIIVTDESITNNTGTAWTSFRMSILDGSTGTTADTRFDPAATGIGTTGGLNVSPFTSASFSQNDQILDLSGGSVANGSTWGPGQGVDNGELVIIALPVSGTTGLRTFALVEQPNGGVTPPVIPLPAAAWTGLSGLVALGLYRVASKIRQFIA